MSLSANFETYTLQNDFVVFFRLGVKDENGQALFASLEALTSKIQGKKTYTIVALIQVQAFQRNQRNYKLFSRKKKA